jgi:hypothetical protein
MTLSTKRGMHRFNWDLHYDPIGTGGGGRGGGDGSSGAVPHRTYTSPGSPWAVPGTYTVRLTVDGKSFTQPITVRLDPRVKLPATTVTQLSTLTKTMYTGARTARSAYLTARALVASLEKAGGDVAAFKAQVEALAPAPPAGGGRGGRGGGGGGGFGAPAAPSAPTLESTSASLLSAAMAMQSAERAPSATQVANCTKASAQLADVMKRWTALKTVGLTTFNAKRKAAGQAPIALAEQSD